MDLNEGDEPTLEKAIELLKTPENVADYGLKVLLQLNQSREINLIDSVVDAVYSSVCGIALAKPTEMQEVTEGADEETADKIKEANEAAQKENAQIEAK